MQKPDASRDYVKPNRCPFCLKYEDCATAPFSNARPGPGDLSVCIRCGEVSQFNDQLDLVKCPPDFLKSLHPQTHREIVQAQAAIRTLYKGN